MWSLFRICAWQILQPLTVLMKNVASVQSKSAGTSDLIFPQLLCWLHVCLCALREDYFNWNKFKASSSNMLLAW